MGEIINILGTLTFVAIVLALSYLAVMATADAVNCARFIMRIAITTRRAGEHIAAHKLIAAWFRYWVGIDYRPDYLVLNTTDEAIYWPGREGTRRYPA